MDSSVVRLLGSTPKMRLSSGAGTAGATGRTAGWAVASKGGGSAGESDCPNAGEPQTIAATSARIDSDTKRPSSILFLSGPSYIRRISGGAGYPGARPLSAVFLGMI